MIRLILLLLVGFAVLAVIAIKMLPWYYTVGGLVLFLVLLKLFAGRIFTALLSMPFKAKGAVLRGASVEVHQIVPTAPPEKPATDGEEAAETDPEEKTPREWHWLDVTVTPQPPKGKFTSWEPGDLTLVRIESKGYDDKDESCQIGKVQMYDGQEFKDDEGMKYEGPQYLRLHIGVVPGVRQLKFQYYFESFGVIAVPEPAAT